MDRIQCSPQFMSNIQMDMHCKGSCQLTTERQMRPIFHHFCVEKPSSTTNTGIRIANGIHNRHTHFDTVDISSANKLLFNRSRLSKSICFTHNSEISSQVETVSSCLHLLSVSREFLFLWDNIILYFSTCFFFSQSR